MKSILLTSTALVAFAGAASAGGHASPISFAGEATLGYNEEAQGGFYWDSSVDVTGTAGLDNGVTATASFGLDIADGNLGNGIDSGVTASDLTVTIAGGGASLTFGDTDPVAEDRFADVDGMDAVSFNDQDTHFDVAGFEAMLVGEAEVAGFTAAISYGVDNGDGNDLTGEQIDAMQIHVNGALSGFTIDFAYQEEFGPTPSIFGISGSTSFGGADVTIAYADNETVTSTGISVSYPVGAVTVGGYYTMNDGDDATDDFGVSADYADGPISVSAAYDDNGDDDGDSFSVEGSYDVGNGLTVLAGVVDSGDAYYVAGSYDLGSGATLLVSYADDENNETNDEIGDPEYNAGATVEVSFSF
jgi:hypothetical protein